MKKIIIIQIAALSLSVNAQNIKVHKRNRPFCVHYNVRMLSVYR